MAIFKKIKKNIVDTGATPPLSEKKGGFIAYKNSCFAPLIKYPWITEKSGNMANLRKYVFLVDKNANKSEISKYIELIYNVKVAAVNIVNIKGKIKKMKTKTGKRPEKRKAIITLKEGNKIETMTI